jgi:glycosyltransferase involved in cell wall biosynthesis
MAAGFARRVYAIEHRPWDGPWNGPLSKMHYGRLAGLLLHRSIGVSDEINASAVDEFHFPARKMRTCLNWVHPDFQLATEQQRTDARTEFGIASQVVLVGFMGRLAPEKRVDVLLRAFAMLPRSAHPVELGITGDGWKRTALTQAATELGIAERVRFFGWSTSPATMLRACDIFVLPSLVEGFPLALIEAMACGCACLAHPMSSTMQLIEDGKSGVLIDMSDAEGLAKGLAGLIERTPEQRHQMGLAAAARIASEFSRERQLPHLLAALDVAAAVLPQSGPRRLAFNRS